MTPSTKQTLSVVIALLVGMLLGASLRRPRPFHASIMVTRGDDRIACDCGGAP